MADTSQIKNITPSRKETPVKKRCGWITTGISVAVVVLLAVLLIMIRINGYATLFGKSMFRVVTGSMEPTIMTGALLIAEDCEIESIRVGDIICFRSESASTRDWVITHRVVSVLKNGDGGLILETKGDANGSVDGEYVTQNTLIGKVIWYTGEGNLLSNGVGFLTSGMGFLTLVMLPCLFISGMLLRRSVRQIRKDIARLQAEVDETDRAPEMTKEEIEEMRRQIEKELLGQRETILAEVKEQMAQQGEHDDGQPEQINREWALGASEEPASGAKD